MAAFEPVVVPMHQFSIRTLLLLMTAAAPVAYLLGLMTNHDLISYQLGPFGMMCFAATLILVVLIILQMIYRSSREVGQCLDQAYPWLTFGVLSTAILTPTAMVIGCATSGLFRLPISFFFAILTLTVYLALRLRLSIYTRGIAYGSKFISFEEYDFLFAFNDRMLLVFKASRPFDLAKAIKNRTLYRIQITKRKASRWKELIAEHQGCPIEQLSPQIDRLRKEYSR